MGRATARDQDRRQSAAAQDQYGRGPCGQIGAVRKLARNRRGIRLHPDADAAQIRVPSQSRPSEQAVPAQIAFQCRRIGEMVAGNAERPGGRDIVLIVVDEQRIVRSNRETVQREAEDRGVGLGELFGARHDDIAKAIEQRLGRAKALPERVAEIGDREQRHA